MSNYPTAVTHLRAEANEFSKPLSQMERGYDPFETHASQAINPSITKDMVRMLRGLMR